MSAAICFVADLSTSVRKDSEGRYCLNDLYKAAGGEARIKPSNFFRLDSTEALINELLKSEHLNHEPLKHIRAGRPGALSEASTLPSGAEPQFPAVSPLAKRLCGDAVVAAVTSADRVPVPVKGVGITDSPAAPTMSSREIAELTGKEHKHVLRDIRTMFAGLEMPIGATAQFWTVAQVPGANNAIRSIEVCNLPEDLRGSPAALCGPLGDGSRSRPGNVKKRVLSFLQAIDASPIEPRQDGRNQPFKRDFIF